MRPAHLLHHYLRPSHLDRSPVLTLLGPADVLMDVLILALNARHPRLRSHPLPDEPWDLQLRRAQTLAALARALQGAMVDYQQDELERIDHELKLHGVGTY